MNSKHTHSEEHKAQSRTLEKRKKKLCQRLQKK